MDQLMLEGPIDLDTYAEITSGSVAARPEQPGDRPLIVADTSAAVRDQILSLCSWDLLEDLSLQAIDRVLDKWFLIY
jgi:hypothetical protein